MRHERSYLDIELKNMRVKVQYLQKKYDEEYDKLIRVADQKKAVRERERSLMEKETRIINKAK